MMKTTATELRVKLISFLDSLIETGEPIEIERREGMLRISRGDGGLRLSRTRDHFDRFIVARAEHEGFRLLGKDRKVQEHRAPAFW